MYRANLDQSLTLKNEKELNLYWIKTFSKMRDNSLLGSKLVSSTQCYWKREYDAMIKASKRQNVPWWKSAGFIDMKILHDPTLNIDPEKLKI